MEILFILINIVLFSGLNTLPVDNEDADITIIDPYLENSIDGDDSVIDISSLGPEAFGIPKNESGEYFAFLSINYFPVFMKSILPNNEKFNHNVLLDFIIFLAQSAKISITTAVSEQVLLRSVTVFRYDEL